MNLRRLFHPLLILTVVICTGIFFVHPVFAASPLDQSSFTTFAANAGFVAGPSVTVIIARLIRTFISFLGIIAVSVVLYGGFTYLTAGGKDDRVKKAKSIIRNGLIGLVIALSSFAITQFILSKFIEATTGDISQYCADHPTDSACKGITPFPPVNPPFTLNPPASLLQCSSGIRNLNLSFVFSKPVKNESGIQVAQKIVGADGQNTLTNVAGTFSVSGQVVTFIPQDKCPAPNNLLSCFSGNSTFHVDVDPNTVKSASDIPLICEPVSVTVNGVSSTMNPCSFDFTTGSIVDTAPPQEVSFTDPLNGGTAYLDVSRSLQVKAMDDSGIASVEFFAVKNETAVSASSTPVNATTVNGILSAYFNGLWTPSGLTTNASYPVWAKATDCAGNSKISSTISVAVHAPNCNNGIQDAAAPYGETGSCKPNESCDCGGDNTSQYFCGLCQPSPCTSSAQCASGFCIIPSGKTEGKCQNVPAIQSVSPDNGAVDNLVTISGSGFGTTPGTVDFLGTEKNNSTKFAPAYACGFKCVGGAKGGKACTENGNECTGGLCKPDVQWSDKEIVVQIPKDAIDGPIKVNIPASGTVLAQSDRTDDAVGPIMSKFDVNSIKRPGLCSLDPNASEINTAFFANGLSFGATKGSSAFYFTNFESTVSNWTSTKLTATVPGVTSGSYNAQVFTGDYFCLDASGNLTNTTCFSDGDCTKPEVGLVKCRMSWCSESLAYCSETKACAQVATQTVCKTDVDCDVANDQFCDATKKLCVKSDGVCSDVRVGSNTKNFVATKKSSALKPTIFSIDTGWMACSGLVNTGKNCSKDSDCGGAVGSCAAQQNRGPSGQYMTIYGSGFGTVKGYVQFTNKTSNVSVNGAVNFPPACGNTFWDDHAVVVKVPFILDKDNKPTSTPIDSGAYDVKVVPQSGNASDAKDFTVVDGKPTPGICLLNPAAGPVGTLVEILGENFGASKGTVLFTSGPSVVPGNWTDGDITAAGVPVGSKSGPLSITDSASNQSNSINFTVGNCKQTPSICTAGQSCCTDGSCSVANQACTNNGPKVAQFAYKVSTSPIPVAPTVVINCSDPKLASPSPSPSPLWSKQDDICVSAAVTASFSVPMDPTTLIDPNIKIQKCPKDKEVNGACAASDWQDVPGVFQPPAEKAFQWAPNAPFETGTLYQVTIKGTSAPGGGVMSSKNGLTPGASMEKDFFWQFRTSTSDAPCGVGAVSVSPDTFVAKNLGEPVGYLAQLLSNKDKCVVLSCFGHSIGWSSSQWNATFLPQDTLTANPGVGICSVSVDPRYNTPPGIPAQIAATVTDVGNKPTNKGLLTIALSNPKVSDYFPNCSSACGNATPWVAFNVPMNPAFLSMQGAVRIYQCQNALCDKSDEVLWDHIGVIPPPDPVTNKVTIPTTDSLIQNTWYRVVIAGWVKSTVFAPLSESGSNYGTAENKFFPGDFSWRFKTKDTALACAVDHIGYSPKTSVLKYIGERQEYRATPYGATDDCSVTGQALQASSYTWSSWTAKDNPNKLGVASYVVGNNASLKEITSVLLNNGSLALSTALPKYCAGNCLFTGNPVKVGQAVCGNNAVESGESCDDGNTTSGDGCSVLCLKEGTSAPVCGNAVKDAGEECDDSNTTNGDGCSAKCLNEGSQSIKSVCGDGVTDHTDKAGGESCDDGNTKDGDGCSSTCLLEGGMIAYTNARCGDGAVGTGETCDDGNTKSGDGCSDVCLNEGTNPGTNPASVGCGNGKTDPGEDAGCDLGVGLIAPGCSKQCLKMGSSSNYTVPSVCGNGGALEPGEQCEVAANAVKTIGPFGVAEVSSGAPVEVEQDKTKATYGYAVSNVAVSVSGAKPSSADFSLLCSCDSDNQCGTKPGDPSKSLGCGASKCCYERPSIVPNTSLPGNKDGVCRNTAVAVTFSEEMDANSFGSIDADGDGKISAGELNPNIQLELTQVAGKPVTFATDKNADGKVAQNEYGATDCPYYPKQTDPKNFFVGLWNWIKGLFGHAVFADATTQCFVPVTYEQNPAEKGAYQVSLRYKQLLLPNAQYKLTVKTKDADKNGVVSKNKVSICLGDNGTSCQSVSQTDVFTTGSDVCTLDVVQTTDNGIPPPLPSYQSTSPGYYSKTNEGHSFTAKPFAVRKNTGLLEQISKIDGVYDWTWGWPTPVKDTGTNVEILGIVAASTSPSAQFKALGKNGAGDVIATATIGADTLDPTKSGTGVSGHVSEIAFLCENPWPDLNQPGGVPFVENNANTNFSLFYCRDIGKPEEGKTLPELDLPPTDATPAVSAKDVHPDVLKELVFRVHNTKDSIGVRVLSNPKYLSPMAWFKSQGFTGTPKPAKLDGYEAVQTGTTIYAAAANRNGSNLYSNIYIVSYNSDAGKDAQQIFDLVLQNFRLNANDSGNTGVSHVGLCKSGGSYGDQPISCSWDGDCLDQCRADRKCSISGKDCDPAVGNSQCNQPDPIAPAFCDADKQKLIRDTKRLTDITDMVATFEKYGTSHGHCSVNKNQACALDTQCSGTEKCLPSYPTVQAGTFIPSMSNSIWPSWNSTLGNAVGAALPSDPLNQFWAQCKGPALTGYDSATCWNGAQGKFVCPDGSHVYGYQNQGGEDYTLSTELEYNAVAWNDKIDQSSADHATIQASYKTGQAPAGIQVGSGFVLSPLYCNASTFGSSAICGDGVKSTNTCVVGDVSKIGKSCVNNADCGANGVCGEKCEKGDVKSIACANGGGFINVACKSDCSDFQSETDATKLGAVCKPFACDNGVKDPGEDCDDGALNGTYGHCGLGCKVASAFSCGDGSLAGNEQCDCGTSTNFQNLTNASWAKSGTPGTPVHCTTYNGGYSASGQTCTADCKLPGPMCGDHLVNGSSASPEVCDGNTETYAGEFCFVNTAVCLTDADCGGDIGSCQTILGSPKKYCGLNTKKCTKDVDCGGIKDSCGGSAVTQPSFACTDQTICMKGDSDKLGHTCTTPNQITDCGASGVCSSEKYPLTRTRTCQNYGNPPVSQSCQWMNNSNGGWSACAGGPQQCGNGKQEGTEECDDGNSSNYDRCTNLCKKNVCGDNYVNVGIESCDSGQKNGQTCPATYGGSCNFCNKSCQYKTLSGPFCGDGEINGNESCDGTTFLNTCVRLDKDTTVLEKQGVCSSTADCSKYNTNNKTFVCYLVGSWNGGSKNGQACAVGNQITLSKPIISPLFSPGQVLFHIASNPPSCQIKQYCLKDTDPINTPTCKQNVCSGNNKNSLKNGTYCLSNDDCKTTCIYRGIDDNGNYCTPNETASCSSTSACTNLDVITSGELCTDIASCQNSSSNNNVQTTKQSVCTDVYTNDTFVKLCDQGNSQSNNGNSASGNTSFTLTTSVFPPEAGSVLKINNIPNVSSLTATDKTFMNVEVLSNPGFEFLNFTGDVDFGSQTVLGNGGTITGIKLDKNKNIIANFGLQGTCVPPVCAQNCGSTCPTVFQKVPLQVQSNLADSQPSNSVSLYSSTNPKINKTPDQASILLPACRVGTGITADVSSTASLQGESFILASTITATKKDSSGNYVNLLTKTGVVEMGNGVPLPFVNAFLCHDVPFVMPLTASFTTIDKSPVTFKNFEFTYCPVK